MLTVSRRGFLVLGGLGAGTALAGCGSEPDPRGEGDDQELLDAAMEAEVALQSAYDNLSAGTVAGRDGAEVVNRSREASSERQSELGGLGASVPSASGPSPTRENNGFDSAQSAANAAIAAYHEGTGLLSTTDLRAPFAQFLAQVASELATIRGLFETDQAPFAFVTGGTEKPLEHPGEETTTSTTTTTTSSTTTDEQ